MTTTTANSPFLHFDSFTIAEHEAPKPMPFPLVSTRSPFISVYESEGGASTYEDPMREVFASLVEKLHDEEFDEALFELQCSARAMHGEQLAAGTPRAEADRLVTQHFAQLVRESEAMAGAMVREFAPREQGGIVESEIDSFLEAYAPSGRVEPEFENFLGSLAKKLGGVAKVVAGHALQGIKNVAFGPIFNQIKTLLRPLLNAVLQRAIGRLPAEVHPAAQRLAQKLGFGSARPVQRSAEQAAGVAPADRDPAASADAAVQPAAGNDAVTPQQEFDEQVAAAVLADDEVELNHEAAVHLAQSASASVPAFAELEDAREHFVAGLQGLAQDESATPHVENFLPAVLPALKVGIRLAGRPRVVNFLAQLLGGLIGKLIGPQQAPALSRAIVDAGLKLINLEMSESETAGLASCAVAATVEETVARVASLPDEVLDNEELLQFFALDAFEHAAAANLPAVLSEATYRRRPDLLEAGVNAGWVLLPLRGPKRYKRCTQVFNVKISPYMADEVESFEGATLAEHLQDQFGMEEGEEVDAQVHLYEALPGTSLIDIARAERETLGPGMSDEANAAQLHPLTPRAAAVLLAKPGLGRGLPVGLNAASLPGGLRLLHPAIGRRVLTGLDASQRQRPRRLLRVDVLLDGVQDRVRVCIFISEVRAQKLAARLRQGNSLGPIAVSLHRLLGGRLGRIFRGEAPARLRAVNPALRPGLSPAAALQNLPTPAVQGFAAKLRSWVAQAFAEYIKAQTARVIAATADPAEGITFAFTIENPPGLKALGQAMAGNASAAGTIAETIAKAGAPTVRVEVFSGRRCG